MLGTLRRPHALRALANTLLALALCIGGDPARPAHARSPRRAKSATAVAPAGYLACRDMPAEVATMTDCWSGPDTSPEPLGDMSLVQCLARFDYDDDGDVDLADHAAYLTAPAIELGFASGVPYECLTDGDTLSVFAGFQGGIHLLVAIRGTGFSPDTLVSITSSGVMVDNGDIAVSLRTSSDQLFTDIGDGLDQKLNYFAPLLMIPGAANGRLADLTFTVTQSDDASNTATVTTRVLLSEDY